MVKAACERYFEKISETIFEICKLIIKSKGVLIKDNEVETLLKLRIIDNDFKERLKKIKGMRNIIIHQYGDVNDKLMFDSIQNKLLIDTKDFIKIVKNSI